MTMDARDLYEHVADLFRAAHTPDGARAVLAAVDDAWPLVRDRAASPEDAETCRLAMLAALHEAVVGEDPALAVVWRARALSRFTRCGWTEGVASIAMGEAFRLLAQVNGDYAGGRTLDRLTPAPGAREVLAELATYLDVPASEVRLGPSAPSRAVLERFRHEKSGFLLLVEGDVDGARASYAAAATAVRGHARGEVKVALGAALVEYVGDVRSGTDTGAADRTEALARQAEALGEQDLAAAAARNVEVMRRRGGDLVGYEIL